ncbi:MAG: single-stranded DNA-binding protein [Clostridium sp.]|nr:single-stranded DNA-binding protein [Clostridium sp.]
MNRVYLMGKIITDIEFKFIINSKNISVAMFKIKTIKDNQIINIKAYNDKADSFFSKCDKGDTVIIEGKLQENTVIVN